MWLTESNACSRPYAVAKLSSFIVIISKTFLAEGWFDWLKTILLLIDATDSRRRKSSIKDSIHSFCKKEFNSNRPPWRWNGVFTFRSFVKKMTITLSKGFRWKCDFIVPWKTHSLSNASIYWWYWSWIPLTLREDHTIRHPQLLSPRFG